MDIESPRISTCGNFWISIVSCAGCLSARARVIEEIRQMNAKRDTDFFSNIIELPFWLVGASGKRDSLHVSVNDQNIFFGTKDKIVGSIDSLVDKKQQLIEILQQRNCVIRPKAVTLTLFSRLYFFDGKGLKHFAPFINVEESNGFIKVYNIVW